MKNRIKLAKALIGILVVLVFSTSLYANKNYFSFKVDGTEIKLKSPDGFYESSHIDPLAQELYSKLMPEGLTVRAVLLPKDGFYDIKTRYIGVITEDQYSKNKYTRIGFERNIKKIIRKQQFTLMSNIRDQLDALASEKSNLIGNDYDIDFKFKINETTPLGVFIDNDNAISFGTIIDVEASVDNESDKSPMFASTTFANIKSKVVVLYIYSLYNSEKDVVWAKAKTNEIINLLLEENK